MEKTDLEKALEIGTSVAGIEFRPRRFREDLFLQAQIDDIALPAIERSKDPGIRLASLYGFLTEAQQEVIEGLGKYLLFDRITVPRSGFGLRYLVRTKTLSTVAVKEEADKIIKNKEYDYELVAVFQNIGHASFLPTGESISNFYNDTPIFYLH
ncbi:MAG: hypothetical protein AABY07_08370, partial [Nanoarchaeota archaeon]